MIRSVLEVFPGFTINDVLDTDYGALIQTINAKTAREQVPVASAEPQQKVVPLEEFIQSF